MEFEAFFAAEYEPMVRALTLALGDRTRAEDAAGAGFEAALRKWRHVAAVDRPGTWVYVVAVRHARRALARAARDETLEPATATEPEAEVVSALALEELLASLTPRQRAMVVLRHLAGLRLEEIGDALGVAVGTVKATLHTAYAKLRVEVATADEPPEVIDATR